MGRNKIEVERKRISRAISMLQENIDAIKKYEVKNISKLIDLLLREYFKLTDNEDDGLFKIGFNKDVLNY